MLLRMLGQELRKSLMNEGMYWYQLRACSCSAGVSGQSGAAGTPTVHPPRGAERSLEGWTELFSESNVTNFSSQEMLKSIKDLLKILRHQNGRCVVLRPQ